MIRFDFFFSFRIEKCKIMKSAKKPLRLVFENVDEGADDIKIIFKTGDGQYHSKILQCFLTFCTKTFLINLINLRDRNAFSTVFPSL